MTVTKTPLQSAPHLPLNLPPVTNAPHPAAEAPATTQPNPPVPKKTDDAFSATTPAPRAGSPTASAVDLGATANGHVVALPTSAKDAQERLTSLRGDIAALEKAGAPPEAVGEKKRELALVQRQATRFAFGAQNETRATPGAVREALAAFKDTDPKLHAVLSAQPIDMSALAQALAIKDASLRGAVPSDADLIRFVVKGEVSEALATTIALGVEGDLNSAGYVRLLLAVSKRGLDGEARAIDEDIKRATGNPAEKARLPALAARKEDITARSENLRALSSRLELSQTQGAFARPAAKPLTTSDQRPTMKAFLDHLSKPGADLAHGLFSQLGVRYNDNEAKQAIYERVGLTRDQFAMDVERFAKTGDMSDALAQLFQDAKTPPSNINDLKAVAKWSDAYAVTRLLSAIQTQRLQGQLQGIAPGAERDSAAAQLTSASAEMAVVSKAANAFQKSYSAGVEEQAKSARRQAIQLRIQSANESNPAKQEALVAKADALAVRSEKQIILVTTDYSVAANGADKAGDQKTADVMRTRSGHLLGEMGEITLEDKSGREEVKEAAADYSAQAKALLDQVHDKTTGHYKLASGVSERLTAGIADASLRPLGFGVADYSSTEGARLDEIKRLTNPKERREALTAFTSQLAAARLRTLGHVSADQKEKIFALLLERGQANIAAYDAFADAVKAFDTQPAKNLSPEDRTALSTAVLARNKQVVVAMTDAVVSAGVEDQKEEAQKALADARSAYPDPKRATREKEEAHARAEKAHSTWFSSIYVSKANIRAQKTADADALIADIRSGIVSMGEDVTQADLDDADRRIAQLEVTKAEVALEAALLGTPDAGERAYNNEQRDAVSGARRELAAKQRGVSSLEKKLADDKTPEARGARIEIDVQPDHRALDPKKRTTQAWIDQATADATDSIKRSQDHAFSDWQRLDFALSGNEAADGAASSALTLSQREKTKAKKQAAAAVAANKELTGLEKGRAVKEGNLEPDQKLGQGAAIVFTDPLAAALANGVIRSALSTAVEERHVEDNKADETRVAGKIHDFNVGASQANNEAIREGAVAANAAMLGKHALDVAAAIVSRQPNDAAHDSQRTRVSAAAGRQGVVSAQTGRVADSKDAFATGTKMIDGVTEPQARATARQTMRGDAWRAEAAVNTARKDGVRTTADNGKTNSNEPAVKAGDGIAMAELAQGIDKDAQKDTSAVKTPSKELIAATTRANEAAQEFKDRKVLLGELHKRWVEGLKAGHMNAADELDAQKSRTQKQVRDTMNWLSTGYVEILGGMVGALAGDKTFDAVTALHDEDNAEASKTISDAYAQSMRGVVGMFKEYDRLQAEKGDAAAYDFMAGALGRVALNDTPELAAKYDAGLASLPPQTSEALRALARADKGADERLSGSYEEVLSKSAGPITLESAEKATRTFDSRQQFLSENAKTITFVQEGATVVVTTLGTLGVNFTLGGTVLSAERWGQMLFTLARSGPMGARLVVVTEKGIELSRAGVQVMRALNITAAGSHMVIANGAQGWLGDLIADHFGEGASSKLLQGLAGLINLGEMQHVFRPAQAGTFIARAASALTPATIDFLIRQGLSHKAERDPLGAHVLEQMWSFALFPLFNAVHGEHQKSQEQSKETRSIADRLLPGEKNASARAALAEFIHASQQASASHPAPAEHARTIDSLADRVREHNRKATAAGEPVVPERTLNELAATAHLNFVLVRELGKLNGKAPSAKEILDIEARVRGDAPAGVPISEETMQRQLAPLWAQGLAGFTDETAPTEHERALLQRLTDLLPMDANTSPAERARILSATLVRVGASEPVIAAACVLAKESHEPVKSGLDPRPTSHEPRFKARRVDTAPLLLAGAAALATESSAIEAAGNRLPPPTADELLADSGRIPPPPMGAIIYEGTQQFIYALAPAKGPSNTLSALLRQPNVKVKVIDGSGKLREITVPSKNVIDFSRGESAPAKVLRVGKEGTDAGVRVRTAKLNGKEHALVYDTGKQRWAMDEASRFREIVAGNVAVNVSEELVRTCEASRSRLSPEQREQWDALLYACKSPEQHMLLMRVFAHASQLGSPQTALAEAVLYTNLITAYLNGRELKPNELMSLGTADGVVQYYRDSCALTCEQFMLAQSSPLEAMRFVIMGRDGVLAEQADGMKQYPSVAAIPRESPATRRVVGSNSELHPTAPNIPFVRDTGTSGLDPAQVADRLTRKLGPKLGNPPVSFSMYAGSSESMISRLIAQLSPAPPENILIGIRGGAAGGHAMVVTGTYETTNAAGARTRHFMVRDPEGSSHQVTHFTESEMRAMLGMIATRSLTTDGPHPTTPAELGAAAAEAAREGPLLVSVRQRETKNGEETILEQDFVCTGTSERDGERVFHFQSTHAKNETFTTTETELRAGRTPEGTLSAVEVTQKSREPANKRERGVDDDLEFDFTQPASEPAQAAPEAHAPDPLHARIVAQLGEEHPLAIAVQHLSEEFRSVDNLAPVVTRILDSSEPTGTKLERLNAVRAAVGAISSGHLPVERVRRGIELLAETPLGTHAKAAMAELSSLGKLGPEQRRERAELIVGALGLRAIGQQAGISVGATPVTVIPDRPTQAALANPPTHVATVVLEGEEAACIVLSGPQNGKLTIALPDGQSREIAANSPELRGVEAVTGVKPAEPVVALERRRFGPDVEESKKHDFLVGHVGNHSLVYDTTIIPPRFVLAPAGHHLPSMHGVDAISVDQQAHLFRFDRFRQDPQRFLNVSPSERARLTKEFAMWAKERGSPDATPEENPAKWNKFLRQKIDDSLGRARTATEQLLIIKQLGLGSFDAVDSCLALVHVYFGEPPANSTEPFPPHGPLLALMNAAGFTQSFASSCAPTSVLAMLFRVDPLEAMRVVMFGPDYARERQQAVAGAANLGDVRPRVSVPGLPTLTQDQSRSARTRSHEEEGMAPQEKLDAMNKVIGTRIGVRFEYRERGMDVTLRDDVWNSLTRSGLERASEGVALRLAVIDSKGNASYHAMTIVEVSEERTSEGLVVRKCKLLDSDGLSHTLPFDDLFGGYFALPGSPVQHRLTGAIVREPPGLVLTRNALGGTVLPLERLAGSVKALGAQTPREAHDRYERFAATLGEVTKLLQNMGGNQSAKLAAVVDTLARMNDGATLDAVCAALRAAKSDLALKDICAAGDAFAANDLPQLRSNAAFAKLAPQAQDVLIGGLFALREDKAASAALRQIATSPAAAGLSPEQQIALALRIGVATPTQKAAIATAHARSQGAGPGASDALAEALRQHDIGQVVLSIGGETPSGQRADRVVQHRGEATFEDGTAAPAQTETIHVGDHSIKLVAPDNAPATLPTAADVVDATQHIPLAHLRLLRVLRLNPNENSQDPNWRAQRNDPTHLSAATGGGEQIDFYPWRSKPTGRAVRDTFRHEIGHLVENKVFGRNGWTAWEKAIASDRVKSSRYAREDRREDFAETYSMYLQVRGTKEEAAVRALMPERFALLDAIFSSDQLVPAQVGALSCNDAAEYALLCRVRVGFTSDEAALTWVVAMRNATSALKAAESAPTPHASTIAQAKAALDHVRGILNGDANERDHLAAVALTLSAVSPKMQPAIARFLDTKTPESTARMHAFTDAARSVFARADTPEAAEQQLGKVMALVAKLETKKQADVLHLLGVADPQTFADVMARLQAGDSSPVEQFATQVRGLPASLSRDAKFCALMLVDGDPQVLADIGAALTHCHLSVAFMNEAVGVAPTSEALLSQLQAATAFAALLPAGQQRSMLENSGLLPNLMGMIATGEIQQAQAQGLLNVLLADPAHPLLADLARLPPGSEDRRDIIQAYAQHAPLAQSTPAPREGVHIAGPKTLPPPAPAQAPVADTYGHTEAGREAVMSRVQRVFLQDRRTAHAFVSAVVDADRRLQDARRGGHKVAQTEAQRDLDALNVCLKQTKVAGERFKKYQAGGAQRAQLAATAKTLGVTADSDRLETLLR